MAFVGVLGKRQCAAGKQRWPLGTIGSGRYSCIMTQDERWITKYNEVLDFMEQNHRNPSRHRIEEHDMLNWLKATRKRMNAGELKEERVELFQKLLEIGEKYKRVNQYQ